MTVVEFLKLLTVEKFSFKVEYLEFTTEIKVTVETFTSIEVYKFGESGVEGYSELQEVMETDDPNIIDQKIQALTDRTLKAWIHAANDLGFKFIYPYIFTGVDGVDYQATGLIPDFGTGKGTIIVSRKDDDEVFKMAEMTGDFYLSVMNPYYYDRYDRERIIETLSDWGWIGNGEKPKWILEVQEQ